MKIRKRAEQKNFIVNMYYYTESNLTELLNRGIIEDFGRSYHLFAEYCDELKVILDEFGFYTTVAVLKTGEQVYVTI